MAHDLIASEAYEAACMVDAPVLAGFVLHPRCTRKTLPLIRREHLRNILSLLTKQGREGGCLLDGKGRPLGEEGQDGMSGVAEEGS